MRTNNSRVHCLEPANSIIASLGGLGRVAHLSRVAPATACRWRMPRKLGGTDGQIPIDSLIAMVDGVEKAGETMPEPLIAYARSKRLAV